MNFAYLKVLADMLDTVLTEFMEDKSTSLTGFDFDIQRRIHSTLYLLDKITYHERLELNSILSDIEALWRKLNFAE